MLILIINRARLEVYLNNEVEFHCRGKLKCSKCLYITSCFKTMLKHTASCTGFNSATLIPLEPIDAERYCICGFSSNDGLYFLFYLCDKKFYD